MKNSETLNRLSENWLSTAVAVLAAGAALLGPGNVRAQVPDPAAPAATAAPAAASAPSATPDSGAAPSTAVQPAAAPASLNQASPEKESKLHLFGKKKDDYTGPNTIVVLPPTPMLDEEGKQRLDPDGKPMFNPPVKQQRNKLGHPLFDDKGQPVFQTATELGYDENGKKLHAEKVKPPKLTPVTVSRGTLVVDGMTAKAALNYNIADLQYVYLFAPGIGVAVVSDEPFPGATEQKGAFNGTSLLVKTGGHTLELTSDVPLLGKGKEAKSAFVLLDRDFTLPSPSPVVGYGPVRKAPYLWPGSKPNPALAGVSAPPVPMSMLPAQVLSPCPAGQMRQATQTVPPGQAAQQPCVPIPAVKPATQATAAPEAPQR